MLDIELHNVGYISYATLFSRDHVFTLMTPECLYFKENVFLLTSVQFLSEFYILCISLCIVLSESPYTPTAYVH